MDVESEPDARARFEVSPTTNVLDVDNFRMIPIRNSVISVDGIRRDTSEHIHKALGIRNCVVTECVTQPTLFTSRDFEICRQYSGWIMRTYCFGLCGSSSKFYGTDLEWCAKCVNKLIWGFLVSCVVSIVTKWRSVSNDGFLKGIGVFDSIWGLPDGLITPCDAIHGCLWKTEDFKEILNNVMLGNRAKMISHEIPWRIDNGRMRAGCASVDIRPIRIKGRFGCWCYPVQSADWLDVQPVDGGPVRMVVWIEYIGDSHSRYRSSDAAPITEVHDIYIILHINSDCLTGLYSNRLVSIKPRIIRSLEDVLRCSGVLLLCQVMEGAASADDRSGVTFTADLCVPWDALEAVVDMDSPDLVSLGPLPDKVGLFGRRKEVAMSRIMKGRDCRSVRFVVPDGRLVDHGFHDVNMIDMEEEREPTIVRRDMTRLREIWPVEVFDHMKWRQQDLELMRKSAKKEYQQTRPMPCRFCGKVRSGHDAPWIEKTASVEKYAPVDSPTPALDRFIAN